MRGTVVPSEGVHILLNLYRCKSVTPATARKVGALIRAAGLRVLGAKEYVFHDGGFSIVYLLAESHCSIHTWPLRDNLVQADVFVCNYKKDNRKAAHALAKKMKLLFGAKKTWSVTVRR